MVPSPGCAPDAYCGWSDKSCGGTDGSGSCTPRPAGCDKNLNPTCGCDGMIYGNPCEAQHAGTDFSELGGCKAPPGMFGCGAHFCALGAYYCKRVAMSNGSTSTCEPAPAGCGGTASCDCLDSVGVECVGTCLSTMDSGILLACQKP